MARFSYRGLVMRRSFIVVAFGIVCLSVSCNERVSMGSEGGKCYGNRTCDIGLQCLSNLCVVDEDCIPDCGSRECGLDPVCSRQSCGICADGYSCQDGECVEGACVPDCGVAECGLDPVCGVQNCGTCGNGYSCDGGEHGECVQTVCVPDCGSVECGPDPVCGTLNCGTCGDGYTCKSGECKCFPDCGTHECGVDPWCGEQICGTCNGSHKCVDGHCVWLAGDYSVNCSNGMCLIPAGPFWMGCNDGLESSCSPDEKPYHEVTLDGYYMDQTEVTQSAYNECYDAGKCDAPCWFDPSSPDEPVVCVTWFEAAAYCAWAGKRLPTEAEWEKAARGTDGRKYPWGNEYATCDYAVINDGVRGCGTYWPWDVCSKSPAGDSPYGLCDMSGNVMEWVSDWYDDEYYRHDPEPNPTGPDSGGYNFRAVRGGCYFDAIDQDDLRASGRSCHSDYSAERYIGFRCAKDAL